jgi:lysyl-tRNA synthetase class I
MKRFALIGAYNPKDSNGNIKLIHISDDINELRKIWKNIDQFFLEMGNL